MYNVLFENIIVISILTIMCLILFLLIFKYLNTKTTLAKYNIDLNYQKSYEDIKKDLNDFITDCFDEYVIFNIGPEGYVPSHKQEEMNQTISSIVISRMSPVFMDKLVLYYNKNSITDIIASQVIIMCTDYVVKHNSIKP